jgi:hypothetical protein
MLERAIPVPNVSTARSERRAFIGASDARTIMGDDEAALLRLWREKRGEVEPEDLSGNLIVQLGVVTHRFERDTERRALRTACKRLLVIFDRRRFPEAHPWPSPVLVDELDAGGLQCRAYFLSRLVAAAQRAVLSLQAFYRRDRYVGFRCQFLLRPSQKSTRCLYLPNRYF